jgi:hypothetical protein
MNRKHLMISLGVVVAIGLLAAFSARSIPAAPAIDPHAAAGVSPFDLQCTAKFPGGFAQCGSQASSCQNCHEVQGEDPINDKGDWHTQHAFGDFCEFCHSGNVQSPDKAEAHTGMVEPLGDLKLNCSSCHAKDYQAKAEVYAKTLGVTLGAKPEPTKAPAAAPANEATPAPAAEQPAPAEPAAEPTKQPESPAVNPETFAATPTSAEVIDYVAQYKSAPLQSSTGGTNLFIAGLVVVGLTIVGGSGVVVWSQKRTPSKAKPATDERSQALAQLMPMLDQLDAAGLRDVTEFVSQREKPEA